MKQNTVNESHKLWVLEKRDVFSEVMTFLSLCFGLVFVFVVTASAIKVKTNIISFQDNE